MALRRPASPLRWLALYAMALAPAVSWGAVAAEAQAPTAEVVGTVTDSVGTPVEGAAVSVRDSPAGTYTDERGRYRLAGIEPGSYVLVVSSMGYGSRTHRITLEEGQTLNLDTTLEVEILEGPEILVEGRSSAEEIRETGFSVSVVESREQGNLTADVNRVLERTPGIHLREAGGLGSGFNLSLNGLSGNQIRYFINGVPMENFGSSLSLDNYPVNLIDRLEIYKGAVPISLGADALGGAVNIVTDYRRSSYLDAALSYGSFGTVRGSFHGQYTNRERGVYARASFYHNRSDNDYWMEGVPVHDLELGNLVDSIRTKRFHDEYTSTMLHGEVGVVDRAWADRLSVGFTRATNRNQYQHPDNNSIRSFGEFHTTNGTFLGSATYANGFGALDVKAFAVAGRATETVADTTTRKYNWAGEWVVRPSNDPKGELFQRRSLMELSDRMMRSNVGAGYELDGNHGVSLNVTQSYLERSGEDRVDELNRAFESPNYIHKNLLGAAYRYQDDDASLDWRVFAKQYWYSGKIVTQDYEGNDVTTEPSLTRTGFGTALSHVFDEGIRLKASYEKAYRIPESYEILGDGIYVDPNPALDPETSHNVNLGSSWSGRVSALRVSAQANSFFRFSRDFIRFNPLGPFGEYENLNNVRTVGVEGSASFNYRDFVELGGNLTYQKLTDRTERDEGLPNTNYESRIPNIPYLFGNARLAVTPTAREAANRLRLYWSVRYTHSFFLTWEDLGDPDRKNVIPGHTTHDLEAEYGVRDGLFNVSVAVNNVTDARVYDNYNIQKPGRSLHVKARVFLQ